MALVMEQDSRSHEVVLSSTPKETIPLVSDGYFSMAFRLWVFNTRLGLK